MVDFFSLSPLNPLDCIENDRNRTEMINELTAEKVLIFERNFLISESTLLKIGSFKNLIPPSNPTSVSCFSVFTNLKWACPLLLSTMADNSCAAGDFRSLMPLSEKLECGRYTYWRKLNRPPFTVCWVYDS